MKKCTGGYISYVPPAVQTEIWTAAQASGGGGSLKMHSALTWSPANRSFLAAAEADFTEDPQKMSLVQRAGVFAGTGTAFGGRHSVTVGFPRLAFLSDERAGDRGHLEYQMKRAVRLVRLLTQ